MDLFGTIKAQFERITGVSLSATTESEMVHELEQVQPFSEVAAQVAQGAAQSNEQAQTILDLSARLEKAESGLSALQAAIAQTQEAQSSTITAAIKDASKNIESVLAAATASQIAVAEESLRAEIGSEIAALKTGGTGGTLATAGGIPLPINVTQNKNGTVTMGTKLLG